MDIRTHYKVEILDEQFIASDNLSTAKTAQLTYLDQDNDPVSRKKYGVLTVDYIYELIDKNLPIDITNCYVHGFSLRNYRSSRNLEEDSEVILTKIDASSAFFDNDAVIDFSHAKFIGDAKFHKTQFGKGLVFFEHAKFENKVDFSNAYFGKGDAFFKFTDFGNDDVTFEHSEFSFGNISFVNSTFGDGSINFKSVKFDDGDVDFHYSKFGKGLLTFDGSTFGGGNVNFSKVVFNNQKVDFKRIDFGEGNANFEGAEFYGNKISFKSSFFNKGKVSFADADLGTGTANFTNTDFGSGSVSFYNGRFGELILKSCELNHYCDLRVERAEKLSLRDAVVRDILDLKVSTTSVDIKSLNFSGMKVLGVLYLDWTSNKLLQLISNQEKSTSHREKAEQFGILKNNFHTLSQYDDEDLAYVEFKRWDLKARTEESVALNPANSTWVYPKAAFEWFVFDKLGHYATDPIRVLVSSFIIYVCFSMFYFIGHFFIPGADIIQSVSHPGPDNELSHLLESFYHSAVTFLTIGYGDYFPSGLFRFVSAVEGWVGVFFMSYFTVAFVQKILR